MSIRKADDYEDELLSFNNKRKRMNLSLLKKRDKLKELTLEALKPNKKKEKKEK